MIGRRFQIRPLKEKALRELGTVSRTDQYDLIKRILAGNETVNEVTTPANQIKMLTDWLADIQRLNQLSLFIGSDRPTEPVDFAVSYGHVGSDIDGVLEELAKGIFECTSPTIVLNGTLHGENTAGVPAAHGLIEMTSQLGQLGIRRSCIQNFGLAYHTGEESAKTLEFAMEHGYHRCVVVGVPHRQLRFTAGLIHAMDEAGYDLAVYHISPASVNWFGQTGGSQNANPAQRWEHIEAEYYARILANPHGNLATPSRMLKYFANRG